MRFLILVLTLAIALPATAQEVKNISWADFARDGRPDGDYVVVSAPPGTFSRVAFFSQIEEGAHLVTLEPARARYELDGAVRVIFKCEQAETACRMRMSELIQGNIQMQSLGVEPKEEGRATVYSFFLNSSGRFK